MRPAVLQAAHTTSVVGSYSSAVMVSMGSFIQAVPGRARIFGSFDVAKRSIEHRSVCQGREPALLKGASLLTSRQECYRVISKSDGSTATGLLAIDVPRSAWRRTLASSPQPESRRARPVTACSPAHHHGRRQSCHPRLPVRCRPGKTDLLGGRAGGDTAAGELPVGAIDCLVCGGLPRELLGRPSNRSRIIDLISNATSVVTRRWSVDSSCRRSRAIANSYAARETSFFAGVNERCGLGPPDLGPAGLVLFMGPSRARRSSIGRTR